MTNTVGLTKARSSAFLAPLRSIPEKRHDITLYVSEGFTFLHFTKSLRTKSPSRSLFWSCFSLGSFGRRASYGMIQLNRWSNYVDLKTSNVPVEGLVID